MSIRTLTFLLLPAVVLGQNADPDLAKQVEDMKALIQKLEQRVSELESRLGPGPAEPPAPAQAAAAAQPALPPSEQVNPAVPAVSNFLRGTSIDVLLDTYYDYNFNDPIGRVNRLRAYDVLSNAFSLNQATTVFENAADLDEDKRWGVRLDLQFGQATETLQGNAANEPRPEVYRNIFQAYGTYIAPIGSGLNIDFGKWSSSLGMEGNFT